MYALERPFFPGWVTETLLNLWDHPPVKLSVDESLQYNDNVQLLPNGATPAPGLSRGDYYSITNFGASSEARIAHQRFFFDANYNTTRYNHNKALNAVGHSVDAGLDWVVGSRCSGRLIAASRLTQTPFQDLVRAGVNNVDTRSFDETASCKISSTFSGLLDSGQSETTNSLAGPSLNDSRTKYVRPGLQYEVASLHTLRAQVTLTEVDFVNRSEALTPGLATALEQRDYQLYYRRIISPKLEFSGTIGRSEFELSGPSLVPPSTPDGSSISVPTYSVTVIWRPLPKITLTAFTASSASAPQSVVADFTKTKIDSLSARYVYSPKLSFVGLVSQSTSENTTLSGINLTPTLASTKTKTASVLANYKITPLLNASLGYTYTSRDDLSSEAVADSRATSNLYMFSVTYRR